MGKRLEFIDCMRGFTMILVVYSHVITFSYKIEAQSFMNGIFMLFRMPLFFFVSGFLAYSLMDTTKWKAKITKRIQGQLIPSFCMLSLYELWANHMDFAGFLQGSKHGYWFTFVVFNLFLYFSVLNLICDYFKAKNIVKLAVYGISIVVGLGSIKYIGGEFLRFSVIH